MILPLMLTDEQMQRVQNARAIGINVDAMLLGIVNNLPPLTLADLNNGDKGLHANGNGNSSHLIAHATPVAKPAEFTTSAAPRSLVEQWLEEDVTNDPEFIRQAEEDWEELKTALNANRAENGERLLFV